ncbi:hypothetical protein [Streptomyces sp. NPDC048663]|uniref:hypothetical protein n=1 Tax=Streptomyces sp. NPDC048663 TaxID=3155638 RepID=UPI0034460FA6
MRAPVPEGRHALGAVRGHLGEGSCFDAARSSLGERVFRVSDLTAAQQRWPAYAPQGHKPGTGSMMGMQPSPRPGRISHLLARARQERVLTREPDRERGLLGRRSVPRGGTPARHTIRVWRASGT